MKTYKDFRKIYIGESDISALVLVGFKNNVGVVPELLHFRHDRSYEAYLVEGEAEIGEHYELVATYNDWMKIYDDSAMTIEVNGNEIKVYRAGEFGCIIQTLD